MKLGSFSSLLPTLLFAAISVASVALADEIQVVDIRTNGEAITCDHSYNAFPTARLFTIPKRNTDSKGNSVSSRPQAIAKAIQIFNGQGFSLISQSQSYNQEIITLIFNKAPKISNTPYDGGGE